MRNTSFNLQVLLIALLLQKPILVCEEGVSELCRQIFSQNFFEIKVWSLDKTKSFQLLSILSKIKLIQRTSKLFDGLNT